METSLTNLEKTISDYHQSKTPTYSNPNHKLGYPIHDFEARCQQTKSPLETCRLYPNTARDRIGMSLEDAEAYLYGLGINSVDRGELLLQLITIVGGGPINQIKLFKDNWSATDDTYEFGGTIIHALSMRNSSENYRSLLDKEEEIWVSSLGDEFTVYRGCNESRIDGVSWTTSRDVAEGFARGHRSLFNSKPVVVSARCSSEDILLAINDREEFEIILNPYLLRQVWVEPIPSN